MGKDLFGNTLATKQQKNKDWTGNGNSVFKALASSHHTSDEREINDYYATSPKAAELLLEIENFDQNILEPSCGEGHLSKVFVERGFNVTSSDLIDRGYGSVADFFTILDFKGDIITNPPYSMAQDFIEHSLNIIPKWNKVAMFLKVQFMEGKARKKMFEENPPHTIWISSSRINCAKNGNFDGLRESGGSAVAYGWYIWVKGWKGTTQLKWFN